MNHLGLDGPAEGTQFKNLKADLGLLKYLHKVAGITWDAAGTLEEAGGTGHDPVSG